MPPFAVLPLSECGEHRRFPRRAYHHRNLIVLGSLHPDHQKASHTLMATGKGQHS